MKKNTQSYTKKSGENRNLIHLDVKNLIKLIDSKYFWPRMKKNTVNWMECQKSTVHKHTKTPISTLQNPDARITHVHIDIVGPLSPSEGYEYVLTMISKFTMWCETIPIKDIRADFSFWCTYNNNIR